jgi:hypothetical protein
MRAALLLGLLYFVVVFTFAFGMGVARTLIVAPRLGPAVAVLLEVPVLVIASWPAARLLLRHRYLTVAEGAVMGATAFVLTMASEAALAGVLRGQTVFEWATGLITPLGLVGLMGQLMFGAMPLLLVGSRSRSA